MSYHRSNSCNSGLFSSAFSFYSPSPLCPPLHLPVLQYSFCWVGSSNLTQKHPPMFPLSPCPGQSTSPGTQQAARWASLAVWTRGLVRKEECVECKWTHTHTQSVKTHLHIHTANWSTPTACWTRQADEEEEWHSFSCLSPFPSHPSSPPQLIHSVHLRGGWRDGLSLIGHKWEGFVYPGGGGVKRVR